MGAEELVLIHGWASDSTIWRETGDILSDIYQAHLIDLPTMSNIFTYRDAVLSLIEERNIGQAYLIGWSLGALVSLQVVQSAPEKVSGLVLVSGTGKFTRGETYNLGLSPHIITDMKRRFVQSPEPTREDFFKQMFSREEIKMGLDKKVMSKVLVGMRRWGAQEAVAGLDYLLECDMLKDLPLISQPALIVHGNRDRICPFKGAEYLYERIPDSQLLTVQNAGHIPFLTNSSFFNDNLREWLASH
ncbi:MAG: alpha/beta fold hydrolase [Actinobacteria bacterium]|nr:alpha/beta fold hydrolase [Actinomycetota bacterium]